MVVHELSICISSKQAVILFAFVSVQYTLAPTSTFSKAGVNFVKADNRGIIYMLVHVRLGKIDGELIMPKAVITPGSLFYQGGVINA